MKYFVVALVAALCLATVQGKITEEQNNKLKASSNACKEKTKVDPALVDNVKKGEVGSAGDSSEFKAFAICLAQSLQLIDEAGEIQKEIAAAYLPADEDKEKSAAELEKCAHLKVDDAENTKFLRSLCIYQKFSHLIP